MPALRPLLFKALRILAVASSISLLGATAAQANPYEDVDQLTRAGKWDEALKSADQYLSSHPRDPQMRLLRGVVLHAQGRASDALAEYQKLIEDYPELPESYNNMAVIYAAQNQFDKARAALEMATRTNPAYASAFENLGDVYARLAGQAYARSSQLNANNPDLKSKMNALRQLFQVGSKPSSSPALSPASSPSPKPAAGGS